MVVRYFIAPVAGTKNISAKGQIAELVGKHRIYAISLQANGRFGPNKGDHVCFYAKAIGIVADAVIAGTPSRNIGGPISDSRYPIQFPLNDVELYLDRPFVLDESSRAELEEFRGRLGDRSWAWFVRNFHEISKNDFFLLTRKS